MNGNAKVIVLLKGGLGNQLFCYAAARRLALVNNAELVLDCVSGFSRDYMYRRQYALENFCINARHATPWERFEPLGRYRRYLARTIAGFRSFPERKYLFQEQREFDPRLLDYRVSDSVYLDGHWQSEGYFKDIETVIRQDLRIIQSKGVKNRLAEEIRSVNSVCVHTRWFAAPDAKDSAAKHNLDPSYYARAIDVIRSEVHHPHFFVFSDDSQAAATHLPLWSGQCTYVSHNNGADSPLADFSLMVQCRHFVIANSTFSWWAAWLGSDPESIVIAPALKIEGIAAWGFQGLLPERWRLL